MNNETRLDRRLEEETVGSTHSRSEDHVFPTPEDAIRADRATVQPPESIASRIAASLDGLPPSRPPTWWQRLFGKAR